MFYILHISSPYANLNDLLVPQAQCPGCAVCEAKPKAAGESHEDGNEEGTAECQVTKGQKSAGLPAQAATTKDSQSAVTELAQEVSLDMSSTGITCTPPFPAW